MTDGLEKVADHAAKPMGTCIYPACEECDKYHGHHCTIPMVISKQIYLFFAEEIIRLGNKLTELENLVTDEILGTREYHTETVYNPKAEGINGHTMPLAVTFMVRDEK